MRIIVVTDVVETRLKIAKKLAVDHTVLISPEQSEQEIIETILNTLGTTPNSTIDACGFESAQRIALKVTTTSTDKNVIKNCDVPITYKTTGYKTRIFGRHLFCNH